MTHPPGVAHRAGTVHLVSRVSVLFDKARHYATRPWTRREKDDVSAAYVELAYEHNHRGSLASGIFKAAAAQKLADLERQRVRLRGWLLLIAFVATSAFLT